MLRAELSFVGYLFELGKTGTRQEVGGRGGTVRGTETGVEAEKVRAKLSGSCLAYRTQCFTLASDSSLESDGCPETSAKSSEKVPRINKGKSSRV